MMREKKYCVCFAMVMMGGMLNGVVCAGVPELTYTTEMQTDFRKGVNWVNLLRADFSCSLGRGFQLDMASISISETRSEPLVADLQVFSNIEEENLPFAPAVLGITYSKGNSRLFAGIRNVNEDYFTSPCTSFFTNSSCGIFPTLSASYPLANYPKASLGVDYKLRFREWMMELSVYNGIGYSDLTGRENIFRFCPSSDGVLGLATVNYQKNGNGYYMGAGVHRSLYTGDEMGTEEAFTSQSKKRVTWAWWTYLEQRIGHNMYALLQYSVNPSVQEGCRSYAGVGCVVEAGKFSAGVFTDYADFICAHEWATELSCKLACSDHMFLQPAVHFIQNSSGSYTAALIRMQYSF